MDLDRYLSRIGFDGKPRTDRETLESLMRAHLRSVPFENLDIHRNVPLSLDVDDLFEKIVVRRRGGFCYELNGLLSAALDEMGFEHDRVACRVFSDDGAIGPPFDHLALAVPIDDATYLVDVGFGEGIRAPLAMTTGATESSVGYERRIDRLEGTLAMIQTDAAGAESGFVIDETPRALSEFVEMCRYHETSSESPFTRRTLCTLATDGGRITLAGDTLAISEAGQKTETTLSADECTRALVEHFGVDLG